MTGERLLAGVLVLIGVAVSFALTVLFFGSIVIGGAVFVVIGLALLALPPTRRAAVPVLGVAGLTLSGPVMYLGLAILQS